MKILIISDYFPPLNSIASLRPYSWAKFWSKMGHDVTVLTTQKYKKENDLNFECSSFEIIEIENRFKKKLESLISINKNTLSEEKKKS